MIDTDAYILQRMTAERTKKRFGSHDVLYSKYVPQIPASAEREYVRITNAYMRILKEELEREFPKLKETYRVNRDEDVKFRNDGYADFMRALERIFNTIINNIVSKTSGFGLRRKMESLANLNRKLTVKEWKKAVKATLGIDIREDYYLGDFYAKQLEKWVSDNVDLIKTIPEDTLEKMKDIVYEGFASGKTTTRMVKEIRMVYGVSRRRAELIARDQTAKLNGQIQRAQQMDAGITEYIWTDCRDGRVRARHRELHGETCSWDNPPVVDIKTGRRCHPGQDYQCRCIGRPVFNQNMTLPLADAGDVGSHGANISARNSSGAKDRFGIITNNNKGAPGYYDFAGKDVLTVESEISDRGIETAVCFDGNGEAIFAQIGDEASIRFTKAQRMRMKGKVVTHNHPLGTPPSPEDLYVLKENKVKELRTCGRRGTYVLRYTKAIENLPDFDVISSLYDDVSKKIRDKYSRQVANGVPAEDALANLGEEIWEEIYKKYGVKPELERRQGQRGYY